MKNIFIGMVLFLAMTGATYAEPPQFMKKTLPEHALGEMLESWGALQGEGATLDPKTRELIALAVAAQIPCEYCIYSHSTRLILKMGASESELKEAIAVAGFIRLWSTVFHGNGYDLDAFKSEFDALMSSK